MNPLEPLDDSIPREVQEHTSNHDRCFKIIYHNTESYCTEESQQRISPSHEVQQSMIGIHNKIYPLREFK